ncbi:MAG: formylglycine-generating enzyme family protein [Treponema sp.]|jgi:formylglycine-generating enzyme required for sulfatase activity|nr:formylglycine-generating enzyme family protein [Treponema sp.]
MTAMKNLAFCVIFVLLGGLCSAQQKVVAVSTFTPGHEMERINQSRSKMPEFVDRFIETLTRTGGGGLLASILPAGPAVPADFVYIQGGSFTMGSPASEPERVIEYCNKRSLREGLIPAYRGSGNSVSCDLNASGYRLPTEAEWEYAAKGGDKGYLTFSYAGSNNADSVGWYWDNSGERTHPVGTKQANSLGLYDMSGNVWEWCWDWYGSYSSAPQSDPAGAASGSYRVLRGGSWFYRAQYLRSANRNGMTPSNRDFDIGFRLVRHA